MASPVATLGSWFLFYGNIRVMQRPANILAMLQTCMVKPQKSYVAQEYNAMMLTGAVGPGNKS